MKQIYLIVLGIILCASCQGEKKNLPFYESEGVETFATDSESPNNELASSNIVAVPFTEHGGVKFIEVKINNTIGVKMILDSGCSGALISVDEANYLYNKGVLTDRDIKGVAQSVIADGSIVENMVVNLREVVIGERIICPNVEATVSANSGAPLLLGNEILNRAASYTIDNENKVVNFNLKPNE